MPTEKKRRLRKDRAVLIGIVIVALVLGIVYFAKDRSSKKEEKADKPQVSEKTETSGEETTDEKRVRLFLTGDGLLHDSVYTDAQNEDGSYDFGKQLDSVLNAVTGYDLAYYNQETILGGSGLGLSGYPTFNSPQEFGDYMYGKGFNLISTANNHCLDKGFAGVQSSREFWNSKENLLMSGTNATEEEYNAIPSMEVNGVKIAFLAYCENTNGINPDYAWEVNYFPGHEDEMMEKIRKAKEENDVVIVSMHWGTEYSHEVNDTQYTLADEITKAGADIVVGNHPHVIQPFQMVNGKPVFYAMGNLISTQLDQENLVGICAGLDIVVDSDGNVRTENIKADFTYTTMEGTYPDLRYNVKVQPLNSVSDDVLQSQECEKQYMTEQELYEASTNILTSLDQSISVENMWN